MSDSKCPSKKALKLSLEELKNQLPRTPYDKAIWVDDFFLKENEKNGI
jgi:hypothetical protein